MCGDGARDSTRGKRDERRGCRNICATAAAFAQLYNFAYFGLWNSSELKKKPDRARSSQGHFFFRKFCEELKRKYQAGLVQLYDTPCGVVFNSDVIFSCLSDANAAGKILFGNLGVLSVDNALEGKGYVEMTGIDPETSLDFCKAIQNKGGRYLEAQLQGSKKEAEDGNLVVLTAGDHSLFEKCQTCFKAMGKTAFYLGNVGYAAKMNMVINLVNSISMIGLSEAFGLADRSGLSAKNVLEILNVTNIACPYLQRKADRIVRRDFQNPEHALQHMQKDIKLCLDLSNTLKQPLLMASTANEILKNARRMGFDGQDSSCIYMKTKF
ncbi:hypothetical protein HHI36_011291 [Cryptolaemus montrouzieri]|uniref:Uncharacterized protein n=1 Tax=Cryptolaemus montrouzieri TaxID=559131 RepID=A0ABD2MLB6_9CUCU